MVRKDFDLQRRRPCATKATKCPVKAYNINFYTLGVLKLR